MFRVLQWKTCHSNLLVPAVAVALILAAQAALGDEKDGLRPQALSARLPGRIRLTLVDEPVIHYATFQSHNQKVVEGGGLIFMSHLRTRNEEYTDQSWRLSVSRDGGVSFTVLHEESSATNPPVLECDSLGNLYLFRVDFLSGDAFLDRWQASQIQPWLTRSADARQAPPEPAPDRITTRIPGGAAGKYAAAIDVPRAQLYFFSHNNSFHRLRLDGSLIDSRNLIAPGPHAILQYPHLSLSPKGHLHLAWTTQKHAQYLYWDIHHAFSEDGGQTFHGWLPDGGSQQLQLPIVADETGASLRITRDDEFESHTWLACGLATEDHWHALYLAQTTPPRQHYLRYDLRTGQRQIDRYPEVAGQSISLRGLDGFFTADPKDPGKLFVLGNDGGHLACLVSHDAGQTWHDHARSDQAFGLYSIGGARCLTEDGAIIGSFTDQSQPDEITDRNSRVYFFRIE
jgi:hypothetical protein